MGGFVAAIESGWVKGQIVDQLIETHEHIEDGSLVRVGLNRYAVEEAPESRPAVFTIDPGIEAEAVRRITAWKDDRDQAAVQRTLEAVRAAAASDGALVEAIVEAVRAHATQGEIMDALKDVYGWGFVTN
jgi:methylmalonyl-CoA mutase N-terminal domain/subunit